MRKTMYHRSSNHQPLPKLPRILPFEGLCGSMEYPTVMHNFKIIAFNCPKAGEYFVSGAEGFVMAYRAPNDIKQTYWIVEPCARFVKRQIWIDEKEYNKTFDQQGMPKL